MVNIYDYKIKHHIPNNHTGFDMTSTSKLAKMSKKEFEKLVNR